MRKYLKMLRLVLLSLPRVIFEYFAWIRRYSRHKERYPMEVRYAKARRLVIRVLKNMNFNLTLDAPELIDVDTPSLFVANHVSAVDPLVLIAFSKKPVSFIAKKETKKYPVVGRLIAAIDGLFLDREDAFQAVRLFREARDNMAKDGVSYCIFPEGTRSPNRTEPKTLPFRPGSLKIAYMAKAPIVTYVNYGSFHVLDAQKGPYHPVTIHPLYRLLPEEYSSKKSPELADAMQKDIEAALPEIIAKDIAFYTEKKNKQKRAKWWKALLEETR